MGSATSPASASEHLTAPEWDYPGANRTDGVEPIVRVFRPADGETRPEELHGLIRRSDGEEVTFSGAHELLRQLAEEPAGTGISVQVLPPSELR